jgi:hypothetical protein
LFRRHLFRVTVNYLNINPCRFEIFHRNFVGFPVCDDNRPKVNRNRRGECNTKEPTPPGSVEQGRIHVHVSNQKDTVRRKNLAPMSMQADHRASKTSI